MDAQECILSARTVRHYSSEPVDEAVIFDVLDAGRATGSGKNQQLWHFILVRDRQQLQCLSTLGTYSAHLADAAFGVVIATTVNPFVKAIAYFDAGRAAQNMILAARAQGLGSCPIGLRTDPEATRRALRLPPDLEFVIAIAFGYPDRLRMREELEFQERVLARRGRRPLADIVSQNTFDGPPVAD